MEDNKLRSVNTYLWNDPFVQELIPDEKLIFMYLLTNRYKKLSGIYEIGLKTIADDTGFNLETVTNCLDRFQKKDKVYYIDNYIILVNNYKHNKFNSSMLINVKKQLDSMNVNLLDKIIAIKNKTILLMMKDCKCNYFIEHNLSDTVPSETSYTFTEGSDIHSESNPIVELPHKHCYFKDSPFENSDNFNLYFSTEKYKKYDAAYYYDVVSKWSETKDKKSKNWIATAQNFAVKDEKEDHPVYSKLDSIHIDFLIMDFVKDAWLNVYKKIINRFMTGNHFNYTDMNNSMYERFLKYCKDIKRIKMSINDSDLRRLFEKNLKDYLLEIKVIIL